MTLQSEISKNSCLIQKLVLFEEGRSGGEGKKASRRENERKSREEDNKGIEDEKKKINR